MHLNDLRVRIQYDKIFISLEQRCRDLLEKEFENYSHRIIDLFLYSVLESSETMCVGEKAVYNWLLRLHPKNTSQTRFRGFNHKLKNFGSLRNIWPYMLQQDCFIEHFVEWIKKFKLEIQKAKISLSYKSKYDSFLTNYLYPLIGISLIHVSKKRSLINTYRDHIIKILNITLVTSYFRT